MTTPQEKPLPTATAAPAPAPAAQAPATSTMPPQAGGCYTCDPATGAVTLATPSTIQE